MTIPELLAPAGSAESIRAAVQSGATAVYMGFGTFNARRGAKNFTRDEMADAIAYCRARGVKTNITLNILVGDRECEEALLDARFLYEAGADALIVQDVGLARMLHTRAPSLALHASTQLTISTLDGARMAKELGFSRVVLARETPMREIRRITAESGVETEIFVHGALCRCYSGQCYLSAVIGRRSGNRGLCAQPCRLPYRYDGKGAERYPLSLKDLSLAHHIPEICAAGISSLSSPPFTPPSCANSAGQPPPKRTRCGAYFRATASPTAILPANRATPCLVPRPSCRSTRCSRSMTKRHAALPPAGKRRSCR